MNSERMRRVDGLIHRELSMLCEREIAPYVKGLVTITKIKTSPDLRHAQVYFSVLGDHDTHDEALKLLLKQRPHLQKQLAANVQLKYTPVLKFHVDQNPEQADHVLSLLSELGLDDIPDAGPDGLPDGDPLDE
ncbi:MAG: 30S ribosome-binding factor RbfA [Lentisphaeria bacterium]|nr:30S ribosome-binding factor RbfA [Lentisphaeria bacterium]